MNTSVLTRLLCRLGLHWWHYPPTVYPEPVERACQWCPQEQVMDADGAWRDR